jgi:hypothetical protein
MEVNMVDMQNPDSLFTESKWPGRVIAFFAMVLGIVLIGSAVFVGYFFKSLEIVAVIPKSGEGAQLISMGILTKAAFGILAVYFGAAAMLAGAATAFYTSRGSHQVNASAGGAAFAVATASPGVAAVIAGAVVVVAVLYMPLSFTSSAIQGRGSGEVAKLEKVPLPPPDKVLDKGESEPATHQ